MVTTIVASAMSETDAEQHITAIREGLETAKNAAYDLWRKEGWRMLKNGEEQYYRSFRDCIRDRFSRSESQVYRLKDIGMMEAQMQDKTGQTPHLLDAHVRELKKLPTIEDKVEALNIARSIADVTNCDMTAHHIQKGVYLIAARKRIAATAHRVIRLAFEDDELTVEAADQLIAALDAESPQVQLTIQELMVQYGTIKEAKLIPLLAKDITREGSSNPSKVFEWVKEGQLMDVPLAKATIADYKRAKYESRRIREVEAEAAKNTERVKAGLPVVERVLCTLYKGDVQKTAKVLQALLGDVECRALVTALTQNAPVKGASANR